MGFKFKDRKTYIWEDFCDMHKQIAVETKFIGSGLAFIYMSYRWDSIGKSILMEIAVNIFRY